MKNIDLNVGGIIGAIAAGIIVAVVVFSTAGVDDPDRGQSRLIILGLIGGAFAGNFLWSLVFKKPQ